MYVDLITLSTPYENPMTNREKRRKAESNDPIDKQLVQHGICDILNFMETYRLHHLNTYANYTVES